MKQLPKLELTITEEGQEAEDLRKLYEEFEKKCFQRIINETEVLFEQTERLILAIKKKIEQINENLQEAENNFRGCRP
jgi:hypothetical protein